MTFRTKKVLKKVVVNEAVVKGEKEPTFVHAEKKKKKSSKKSDDEKEAAASS